MADRPPSSLDRAARSLAVAHCGRFVARQMSADIPAELHALALVVSPTFANRPSNGYHAETREIERIRSRMRQGRV